MKQTSRDSATFGAQISHIVREAVLIMTVAVSLFLILSFVTYSNLDPGWSSTGMTDEVLNLGGKIGAYFADVFLYSFGFSGYLFPVMLTFAAWAGFYRAREGEPFNWPMFLLRLAGFVLIILSSTGLESLHLAKVHAFLPLTSGGIFGEVIGVGLAAYLSVVGASLMLLALFSLGVTLFTGMSWSDLLRAFAKTASTILSWTVETARVGYPMVINAFDRVRSLRITRAPAVTTQDLSRPNAFVKPTPAPRKKAARQLPLPAPRKEPSIVAEAFKKAITKKPMAPKKPKMTTAPTVGMPGFDLLDQGPAANKRGGYSQATIDSMSREVETRLSDFGITAQVVNVYPGPVITRFELSLAPGIKVSRVTGLGKDLARSLSVVSVRVVEVIPGKSVIGLEVPNAQRETVRLREVLESPQYEQAHSALSLALGRDIAGHSVIVDLAKMPHLLVAGTTGSGKSVSLNAMLLSLLYKATPKDVRFIMIDPKMLELSIYEGIPHLLTPVVTDMKEAANALRWCVAEMDRRYRLMAHMGVRSLAAYNKKVAAAIAAKKPIAAPAWYGGEEESFLEHLPFIVVLVDEYADMMMVVGKKVEELIARIAQKARAAGIHLILATQRPSVDVITGLIKANVPTRIAFQVSSRVDSRTILDQQGAEQLLGNGDMLYLPPGTGVPVRVHGAFVADDEVHQVVADWKARGEPNYLDEILQGNQGESNGGEPDAEFDALYDQAVAIVTESRRASISYVQRRLKIGYNRSARLLEQMEASGVVSSMQSSGAREVLAPPPPKD